MKIDRLSIRNFRGVRELTLEKLGIMIIIAGQNGSGKSCIFDAIRFLKSAYGGYQQNEWQQWMGEFKIPMTNQASDFTPMFNDPTQALEIKADFSFSETERHYIEEQSEDLLRETVWRSILPEAYDWGGTRMAAFAAQFRAREAEVRERVTHAKPKLLQELKQARLAQRVSSRQMRHL